MFLVPAYYFISQNYQIFLNLAYDVQPRLLEHLEREMVWLKAFFVASFFVITGISMALGIRMTKMFIAPLVRMESHMRHLLLGQWHVPEYQVHEDEDFRDLSMTYDYFYRSLRATTESELKMLESLVIDPQNREAYAAWKTLMELKRSRLGITEPFIVRDEESSEVVPLRRVS